MWRIIATIVGVAFLGACVARVEPPKAEVIIPAVKVESPSNGQFCPPGQAKKGRC